MYMESDTLERGKNQFSANYNRTQLHSILVDTALKNKRGWFSIKAKRKWMRNREKKSREILLKLDGVSEISLVQAGINKGNHVQSTLMWI